MSDAGAFLTAIGRQLSVMSLYGPGHPARVEGMNKVTEELTMLLRGNAFPAFSFLDGDVVYEGHVLSDMRHWEWSLKLAEVGIERLEVGPGTTREALEGFLEEAHARMSLEGEGASFRELDGQTAIRFGGVTLDPDEAEAEEEVLRDPLAISLEEEAEVIQWLHGEIDLHGVVPADEAAAVVKLLSVAMHSEHDVVVPLVQLKSVDQYTTSHSINVSCLSMALAEHLNFVSSDVRTIGEAALLHDVGKTKIPLEVLNKKGKLTDSEWKLIQSHTVEGARILLASGAGMELAATVAYEHHLSFNGEGYPELTYPRQTHEVSRLIQVCDVYDALRTRRPFRPPWPAARTIKFLEEKAGTHLDPDYVPSFIRMIENWEPRQVELQAEGDEAAA
ncbi:MAG: HD domain-containing protein [Candidatus Palauibacterales bacterium]|nr:HD domain-containing protein [Candidatus Palauibacterales bacterium]